MKEWVEEEKLKLLKMIQEGITNKQMAKELNRSVESIKSMRGKLKPTYTRLCNQCKKEFTTTDSRQNFCNWICGSNNYDDKHSQGGHQDAISDMQSNRTGYRLSVGNSENL